MEKFDDKTDVFLEEEGLANPGKYISGSIKPDLILTDRESGKTVVFDVKYKDYTNGDSRNDRLQIQQILFRERSFVCGRRCIPDYCSIG